MPHLKANADLIMVAVEDGDDSGAALALQRLVVGWGWSSSSLSDSKALRCPAAAAVASLPCSDLAGMSASEAALLLIKSCNIASSSAAKVPRDGAGDG